MTTITVRRDGGGLDKLRRYRILVDGNEVGRLGEKGRLSYPVSEGPHTIEARIDWCASPVMRFEATGEDLWLVVDNTLHGWRALLAPFFVIFRHKEYLCVDHEFGHHAARRGAVQPSTGQAG